jgi:hypothetical protein
MFAFTFGNLCRYDLERAKVERLNKFDGSGWKNRVTQPVEFQFNKRPGPSSIKVGLYMLESSV